MTQSTSTVYAYWDNVTISIRVPLIIRDYFEITV